MFNLCVLFMSTAPGTQNQPLLDLNVLNLLNVCLTGVHYSEVYFAYNPRLIANSLFWNIMRKFLILCVQVQYRVRTHGSVSVLLRFCAVLLARPHKVLHAAAVGPLPST